MEKNEENAKATENTQEPPIKKKSVYLPKSVAFGESMSSNLAELTKPIVPESTKRTHLIVYGNFIIGKPREQNASFAQQIY